MSQLENTQYQNPYQDRSKADSNRQLPNSGQTNGSSQRNVDGSEQVPRRSSQPNNFGTTSGGPPIAQHPSFNYPVMGQQTLKEQDSLEQLQKLMKENETLRFQWRAMEQDNQKLKNEMQLFDSLLSAQVTNREKAAVTDNEDLQQQIVQLRNENKRLTSAISEDQYQLLDLQKLRKQVELNKGLDTQIMDLESQITNLNKQLLDQKRQNALQESDHQNQREILEKYKTQIREQTLTNEAQNQKNETLLSDNRKMKLALDMINKELKLEQEQNQALVQKFNQLSIGSKDQIGNLQKTLSNLNFQNEQLKNQITQLQQKEKELQNQQNQNMQLESKLRQMQQLILEQQRQIDQYNQTISTGKNEYTKLAQKNQLQEQEIWKLKEQLNQLNTQKEMLQNKSFQLEKTIEDSLSKSQIQSADLKGQLEKWKNYGMQLESELKKREMAIVQLENEYQQIEGQLKSSLESDNQLRIERTQTIAKMKEMHSDLLLYEKKCYSQEKSLQILEEQLKAYQQNLERLESEKQQLHYEIKQLMEELHRTQSQFELKNRDHEGLLMKHDSDTTMQEREINNLRQQNTMLAEKNRQLEVELAKEREKMLQMDSRIRALENEIHNLQFQQTLKQQYSWNPETTVQISAPTLIQNETNHGSGFQAPVSKPTEVSNAYSQLESPQRNASLIKSKNYDLRFQNQQSIH